MEGLTASRPGSRAALVESAAIRRCAVACFSHRAEFPADGRRFQSVRASAARPARPTLPLRSRRTRRRTPHRRGPAKAPRAEQTAATASPSQRENSADCHCPAPDSSDGNTKSRSVTAQATSALDRVFSSATLPAATPQTAPAPLSADPWSDIPPSTTCARWHASGLRSTFGNFRNASRTAYTHKNRDAEICINQRISQYNFMPSLSKL